MEKICPEILPSSVQHTSCSLKERRRVCGDLVSNTMFSYDDGADVVDDDEDERLVPYARGNWDNESR